MVLSVICINSTEINGGSSSGFFARKGRLNVPTKIIKIWKVEEIIILLCTIYLSLYGSDISATLVKADPDNMPIISKTLP